MTHQFCDPDLEVCLLLLGKLQMWQNWHGMLGIVVDLPYRIQQNKLSDVKGHPVQNVPYKDQLGLQNHNLLHTPTRWLGFCTEAVTDIDNFVVEYSDIADVSVQDKAMILAATFLIDLMYYEESG